MDNSYFIGGKQFGLQKNVRPFWLFDQAYATLENVFPFRERLQKKPGWVSIGRLQRTIIISLANADGTATYTVADVLTSIRSLSANAEIKPSSITLTFDSGGANETQYTDNGSGAWTFVSGPYTINTGTSSINYVSGAIVLNFTFSPPLGTASSIALSYYPTLPVMGLEKQENTVVNVENTLGFDTIYAYSRTGTGWEEANSTWPATWNGNNYNLFQSTNYFATVPQTNVFWCTNSLPSTFFDVTTIGGAVAGPPSTAQITTSFANGFSNGDVVVFWNMSGGVANYTYGTVTAAGNPFTISVDATGAFTNGSFTGRVGVVRNNGIRYYDSTSWYNFTPLVTATDYLAGALIVLPFKGRLLAFNTTERDNAGNYTQFRNRVRASVSYPKGLPTSPNGWRTDLPGNGFFLDAPTSEAIVAADFLKDRLIVYFERSTWELSYTGNETLPFIFRKLNRELGVESTHSLVPFDDQVIGIGFTGVHSCNGVNVDRVDQMIPDQVFKISNNNQGPQRVSAIRDYQLQMAYFSYPDKNKYSPSIASENQIYPNRVLAYNYLNGMWAEFEESFTKYGFYQISEEKTWAELDYLTWAEWDTPWNSGLTNISNLVVAAGNQQGFTFSFQDNFSSSTDASLTVRSITNVANGLQIESPDHNLSEVSYDPGVSNGGDYLEVSLPNITLTHLNTQYNSSNSYQVIQVIDKDNFVIDATSSGTYLGAGTIKKLFNFNIFTKDFNPFMPQGQNVRISYVDFLVDPLAQTDNIPFGFAAYFYLNDSDTSFINPLSGTHEIELTPSSLVPFQVNQNSIWKRKNVNAIGQFVQIEMTHSNNQMRYPVVSQSQFVLHALHMHVSKSGRIAPS